MRTRIVQIAVAVTVLAGLVLLVRQYPSLETLAADEQELRSFLRNAPIRAVGLGFVVYVVACLLPGTTGKSLAYGWLFGFWPALLLVNVGSTLAATLSFFASRRWFRTPLYSRFAVMVRRIDGLVHHEGAFYLFSLRLVPFVPFTLLNPVMGLTSMRARTFWWVSQLGMLPGNCVCAYAGASIPDLRQVVDRGAGVVFTPQLLLAFALLAAFPFVARTVIRKFRGRVKRFG